MKITIIIVSIVMLICSLHFYNNSFTDSMLEGTYVNRNYQYEGILPDIPYEEDTLVLLPNNRLYSSYWGQGTYSIIHSIIGTQIDFTSGGGARITSISRLNYGNPKIILFEVKNHYYEKID